MIAYFSGTGNTEWVAKRLSTFLSDTQVIRIPVTSTIDFSSVDTLGICFPIHSWGIPAVVLDFINQLPEDQTIPYLYMVCTCGDDIGLTVEEFQLALSSRNQKCQSFFSVQMPNSYVNLPGFDIDSVSRQQEKIQAAQIHLQKIVEIIRKKESAEDVVKGAFPWIKSKVIRPFFNKYLVDDSFFHVDESCRSCGACERICPVGNIHLETRPQWTHQNRCLTCMACYHTCPAHAISFGKYTKKKGQYLFKNTKN